MTKPLTELRISGNPDAVDSFAACLCAVLTHFDRPAPYALVEALTGVCFAPCHNRSESCAGWMVDLSPRAQDELLSRTPWLGEALGLSLETIRLAPGAPASCEWLDEYKRSGTLPPSQQAYFQQLRAALDDGCAVMVGTWPSWSILIGWQEDITQLPFTTVHGFEETVQSSFAPACTGTAVAVSPGPKNISQKDGSHQAIHFGAQVAAGLGVYDASFGPDMYALLAGLSHEPHLCPGCHEDSCFSRAAGRIANGQQAAVDFLKMGREWMDGVHDLSLENLIEEYDHMHLITLPYSDWSAIQPQSALPEFRDKLCRDFSELQVMQIQIDEHFQSLVED